MSRLRFFIGCAIIDLKLMNSHRLIVLILAALVVSTLAGCAKFPDTPATVGKQLILTMRVRGRISPIDQLAPSIRRHYFIALDTGGDRNVGPWAVAYPPYGGTGWVTSREAERSLGLTSFIAYDAANPGGYLYGVVPGSFFLNTTRPRPPIRYELLDGGATLRFTVDLSQLASATAPVEQIGLVNVNFITTNQLAVDPNELYVNRQWDGLGPTGQDYVTIDTANDRLYYDDDVDARPIADADLDIVYWSIQVQTVTSR